MQNPALYSFFNNVLYIPILLHFNIADDLCFIFEFCKAVFQFLYICFI